MTGKEKMAAGDIAGGGGEVVKQRSPAWEDDGRQYCKNKYLNR